MSTSVLPLSEGLSLCAGEAPYYGCLTFADGEEALKQLEKIREHVRWHGTSVAHGALHGAIEHIVIVRDAKGFQSLVFVDNNGRQLLIVEPGDSLEDQDLGIAMRLIEFSVPTYIVERATSEGAFTFSRIDGLWRLLEM